MKSLESLSEECINLLHMNNLLQPLIRSVLIRDILSKVQIEESIKTQIINDFLKQLNIVEENNLNEWLKKNKLEKEDLEDIALKNIRLKKYSQSNFDHKVEARFLERKSELDIVVYSLIRVNDFFKARELYLRLIGNEAEFGDLAVEFSEGIEKKTRGIVGPLALGRAHPKLAEQLTISKPGIIQPPIDVDGSFLVIRVESYDAAQLDDFMREKIAIELFENWIDDQAIEFSQNFLKDKINSNHGENNE